MTVEGKISRNLNIFESKDTLFLWLLLVFSSISIFSIAFAVSQGGANYYTQISPEAKDFSEAKDIREHHSLKEPSLTAEEEYLLEVEADILGLLDELNEVDSIIRDVKNLDLETF